MLQLSRLGLVAGLLAGPVTASGSAPAPPIPYADLGGCPYECCAFRDWRPNSSIPMRSDRMQESPVAFTVRPGERVTPQQSVVITSRAGEILAKKTVEIRHGRDLLSVPAGERLYSLHALGEGMAFVWYRGKLLSLEVPPGPHSDPTRPPSENDLFRTENEAETEWWVAIENMQGQIGWSNEPHRFDNIEACN